MWAEHGAQGVAVDQLDVALAAGGFVGGLCELAAGDDDGAGGVLVGLEAKQFVHRVVGNLFDVPMFALDQDVLAVLAQFQVDAAIEPGTAAASADMIDAPALPPVVIGQHRFQPVPPYPRQCVVAAVAYVL